jgi:hypothetical protein
MNLTFNQDSNFDVAVKEENDDEFVLRRNGGSETSESEALRFKGRVSL